MTTRITPTRARQGENTGRVRAILLISLVVAIITMIAVYVSIG